MNGCYHIQPDCSGTVKKTFGSEDCVTNPSNRSEVSQMAAKKKAKKAAKKKK